MLMQDSLGAVEHHLLNKHTDRFKDRIGKQEIPGGSEDTCDVLPRHLYKLYCRILWAFQWSFPIKQKRAGQADKGINIYA